MKRLSAALLAIGLAASGSAFAQSTYSPSDGGYYGNQGVNNGQQGDAYFDYARVIRVDPVIDAYRAPAYGSNQRCYETRSPGSYPPNGYYGNGGYYGNEPYAGPQYGAGTQAGRNVASVVGGIAGALIGSNIGGGTGTYAATAIGTMVGSMAGRQVYENNQRSSYTPAGTVRVCEPDPTGNGYYGQGNGTQTSAYDVTYEYNGRQYTRRMDYHPGDRVRVRVDVTPQ